MTDTSPRGALLHELLRLFWEVFKIALFVVGGGYAILAVADDVFGRRLKWLKEGELIDRLPVFQMVPGLIAGNMAIYVGLRRAGRLGALVGLFAVALPAYLIFLAVSCGFNFLPVSVPWVAGGLGGLRAALTGILVATLMASWRRNVRGVGGYALALAASVLVIVGRMPPVLVLFAAMGIGVIGVYVGQGRNPLVQGDWPEITLSPIPYRTRLGLLALLALVGGIICFYYGTIVRVFVQFGLLGFGGGFVLVPLYLHEFVGAGAPLLQLPPEEFSNLIALTQTTPGPISVNAATFFGYRLGGVMGAAVATGALLLPSYFLLTAALTGLTRWQESRLVRGILAGVRPATTSLLISAGIVFARLSIWTLDPTQTATTFHPLALVLAILAAGALLKKRCSVMTILFLAFGIGAVAALWA